MSGNRYPVTKNGKLDEGRIKAAIAYGAKYGELPTLKRNGLCDVASKKGIHACGGRGRP